MDILLWYHQASARVRTVRATCVVLLGLTTVRGLQLSTCGSDGLKEVMADQTTNFTCGSEGKMEWRLLLNGNLKSYNLATREGQIYSASGLFGKTFKLSVMDAYYTLLVINATNNREIYDFVHILNGSLECTRVAGQEIIERASCHLSYVAPPEQVSCSAVSASWYVQVSCVIGSLYSSRRNYMCQLIRLNKGIKNESLETVTMVTSPTREKIAEKEVKVSGSCQFVTTHPAEEGRYRFYVSVSPGGRTYPVKFTTNNEWIMTSRPRPPRVACDPQPFVLENTNVSCACSTTSLGQPPGSLRWIVGDQTGKGIPARKDQQVQRSQEVHYAQSLTLSDHGATWFRCDVLWGSEEIRGEIYIASVGYAARTPLFSLNDQVSHHTIKEGDKLHFRCESDGQPPPQVYVYNRDNGTVIGRNSSFINYVSVADCEDTATYTCSAWNSFSNLSNVTNSISVDVRCKPRLYRLLPVHLVKIDTETKTLTCNFDVLAYPAPHQYNVREPKRNSSETSNKEMSESMIMNVSCEPDTRRRYLFRCTLTIFNLPSPSVTGLHKIEIINEVGEEIFPTEICYEASMMRRLLQLM